MGRDRLHDCHERVAICRLQGNPCDRHGELLDGRNSHHEFHLQQDVHHRDFDLKLRFYIHPSEYFMFMVVKVNRWTSTKINMYRVCKTLVWPSSCKTMNYRLVVNFSF